MGEDAHREPAVSVLEGSLEQVKASSRCAAYPRGGRRRFPRDAYR